MIRRTIRRLQSDYGPFGGGTGGFVEWFSREPKAGQENPFKRLDPDLISAEPSRPEPPSNPGPRPPPRRGAPGFSTLAEAREAMMMDVMTKQKPNKPPGSPGGAPGGVGGDDSDHLGSARNAYFNAKHAPGAAEWRVLETEINLIGLLVHEGRQRDFLEVVRRGEALWEKLNNPDLELPSHFMGPVFLAQFVSQAYTRLKDHSHAKIWKGRERELRAKRYNLFPSAPEQEEPPGGEEEEEETIGKPSGPSIRKGGFTEDTGQYVAGPTLHDKSKANMVKRQAGAFHMNKFGKRKSLFHEQNSVLDKPGWKAYVGVSWESGPRFPR